jgi:hypothetical protein
MGPLVDQPMPVVVLQARLTDTAFVVDHVTV